MRVAVVWNSDSNQVLQRLGQPCPETYGRLAVENVVAGLREGGHTVDLFEGDAMLLENLKGFFPPDGETWIGRGMVFNMAYGIQGECRYTHVPAMLEMAGIPYTGSCPLGHALSLDKVITKILVRDADLPTPQWVVAQHPDQDPQDLRFPLIVKPRHESTSFGLQVVHNRDELAGAVLAVLTQYDQDALVEEFIDGREVCIGLLGNDPVECLPLVELDYEGREMHAFTWEDKMHKRLDEPLRHCPADLPQDLAVRLREIAAGTFRACHCKDYARVDFRIDPSGNPYVLEINSMASLGTRASYVMAAAEAGYNFASLVCRILDVACCRYFGTPASGETRGPADHDRAVLMSADAAPSAPQPAGVLHLSEEQAA